LHVIPRAGGGPDKGVVLTGPFKILAQLTALAIVLLFCGCVPLEQMDKASGSIEETDYLGRLAGIYEAVLHPEAADKAIITLRLYPDGSCLFTEKTIGGPAGGLMISTGRWDHSDFSEGVTLRLKGKNGARRIMQYARNEQTGGLMYAGQGYGADGLALMKK